MATECLFTLFYTLSCFLSPRIFSDIVCKQMFFYVYNLCLQLMVQSRQTQAAQHITAEVWMKRSIIHNYNQVPYLCEWWLMFNNLQYLSNSFNSGAILYKAIFEHCGLYFMDHRYSNTEIQNYILIQNYNWIKLNLCVSPSSVVLSNWNWNWICRNQR